MFKRLMLVFSALLCAHSLASAAPDQIAAVKTNLMTAREHLLAMLDAADAAAQDKHATEVAKATKLVDSALTAALTDKAAPAGAVAKLKEFKTTWEAFKKTRDGEIIPAIKANDKAKATGLAKGVQAERFKKLTELLGALGAK